MLLFLVSSQFGKDRRIQLLTWVDSFSHTKLFIGLQFEKNPTSSLPIAVVH